MGIGAFTETPERRRVVDFFQPLWEEPITYIMSSSAASEMDNSLRPFEVMIFFVVIGFLLEYCINLLRNGVSCKLPYLHSRVLFMYDWPGI